MCPQPPPCTDDASWSKALFGQPWSDDEYGYDLGPYTGGTRPLRNCEYLTANEEIRQYSCQQTRGWDITGHLAGGRGRFTSVDTYHRRPLVPTSSSGVTIWEACGVGCFGDDTRCPEFDNCWDSPCLNGGTCTDGTPTFYWNSMPRSPKFTCHCAPSFCGPTCAIHDDGSFLACTWLPLDKTQRNTLRSHLPTNLQTVGWERCFSTFTDDANPLVYHQNCDQFNQTIVLAKNYLTTEDGGMFAGYVRDKFSARHRVAHALAMLCPCLLAHS